MSLPDHPEPLLTLKALSIGFGIGAEPVTKCISFGVFRGQTVALVGESGSGKSVTAMAVPRLMQGARIVSGEIEFNGRRVDALPEAALRSMRGKEVGFIFQEPMTSLNPVLKVGDQIAEAYEVHHPGARARSRDLAKEWMARVGIENPSTAYHAYPHQFSGGMRQRVMIAMALICSPSLLIADEPTTALDVTVQATVMELIRDLRNSLGMAVLLVTHDMGVVAHHADAVCVMYRGRVMEFGPVQEVIARPLHPYTKGLLLSAPQPNRRGERLRTVADVMDHPNSSAFVREMTEGQAPYLGTGTDENWSMAQVGHQRWVAVNAASAGRPSVPFLMPQASSR